MDVTVVLRIWMVKRMGMAMLACCGDGNGDKRTEDRTATGTFRVLYDLPY